MNKTIFITGSTDGIGKLAAVKLAKDGHEIYLHGRNAAKLSAVITEIKTLSGNDNIQGFVADFSDLNAIKLMSDQINAEVPKIDVLINNAGVFKSSNNQNKNELDLRFVVNYFAPYLLTNALMPLIQKGQKARVINLSSAAQAPVSFEALSGKKPLSQRESYAQSKLALTMWSFHLAKTWKDIAVFAVNPGSLLNTNMVRDAYGSYWSPADKGGNILYDIAVSDEYNGLTAKYFDNDKGETKGAFGDAHGDAYNTTLIEQLIQKTDTILQLSK